MRAQERDSWLAQHTTDISHISIHNKDSERFRMFSYLVVTVAIHDDSLHFTFTVTHHKQAFTLSTHASGFAPKRSLNEKNMKT